MHKYRVRLLVGLLSLFVLGELSVRIVYYIKYDRAGYLFTPFYRVKPENAKSVQKKENMIGVYENGDALIYNQYIPGRDLMESTCSGTAQTFSYFINNRGFRHAPFSKRQNKLRIVVLGDSTVANLTLPLSNTWPVYLNGLLKNHDIEIINLGVGGAKSNEVYHIMRTQVPALKPDLILAHFGFNDAKRSSDQRYHTKGWLRKVWLPLHLVLHYNLMSYTYAIEKISILTQGTPDPFIFFPHNPLPNFSDNFKKMMAVAQKLNIPFFYIAQNVNQLLLTDSVTDQKLMSNFNDILNHAKGLLLADKRNRWIDPRETFQKILTTSQTPLFCNKNSDLVHLSSEGNRLLAELIAKEIGPFVQSL